MPTFVSLYQFAKDVSDLPAVYAEIFVEWVDNNFQGYKNTVSRVAAAYNRIIQCPIA